MRKTIRKIYFIWDFDKEEAWINKMASIGLNLVGVSLGRYDFEEGNACEYTYRVEMLDHWGAHYENQNYIKFVEETGAEHIGTVKNWAFFRKKTVDGEFALHSDIDSKLEHLNRVIKLNIICLIGELCCLIFPTITVILNNGNNDFIHSFFTGFTPALVLLSLFTIWMAIGLVKCTNKKKELLKNRSLYE